MRVHVRTFATLRELSVDRCDLDLAEGADVAAAWTALAARHPGLVPHRPFVRAARNGAYAGWADALGDDDEVAFLPPVSGGTSIGLTDGPIDVAALEREVALPSHGALVTFVGRARDHADDGRPVIELEYEAFPEMAAAELAAIAGEAEAAWGATVAVVHRTGLVPLGEAAVAIVVAAPHRGAAYEANRFVIEQIKLRLPIWKRERFADGSEWKRPGA
ncbi:MAG TPA: molybdenum cofactor biosynthesis protein MoaE [Candidatus Limnocylindria bacterium]|nr:molybdenum cofactor biosynthesis protein MoaE [Candidatus Limnocylindria bacterium]